MNHGYRLSSPANADFESIVKYVASKNLDAALALIDDFTRLFDLIAAQPGLGEVYDKTRSRSIRRTSFGDYLVFYQPLDDGVVIARILHGAQNWQALV